MPEVGKAIYGEAAFQSRRNRGPTTSAARADYVARNPVATKRVLRAILKSADLCSSNPELAAEQLAASGMLSSKENVLGTLRDTRHEWRDFRCRRHPALLYSAVAGDRGARGDPRRH